MRKSWIAAGSLAALVAISAARAETPDPVTQPVQAFYDVLLDSMKHAKELGVKGRFEKLKPVIVQTFDLPDMARIAVGPSWATMSAADQQALQAAFERYSVANYASSFDGYDGEKFIVEPNVQARGLDKVVLTKLVTAKETYPFYYIMRQVGGSWKVINVLQNGTISTLAVQRSDFAGTLSAGGATALVKKLNAQSDKLMKE